MRSPQYSESSDVSLFSWSRKLLTNRENEGFQVKVTNRVSVNIQTFKPAKSPNKWSVTTDQKK